MLCGATLSSSLSGTLSALGDRKIPPTILAPTPESEGPEIDIGRREDRELLEKKIEASRDTILAAMSQSDHLLTRLRDDIAIIKQLVGIFPEALGKRVQGLMDDADVGAIEIGKSMNQHRVVVDDLEMGKKKLRKFQKSSL